MAKKKTKKKPTTHKAKPLVSETVKKHKHKTHPSNWTKRKVTNEDWTIVMLVVAAVLILGIFAGVANLYAAMKDQTTVAPMPIPVQMGLPPALVSEKAIEFIQTNLVPEGVDVQITSVSEESGLYKLDLVLTAEGETIEAESYATKDGKVFFISGMEMDVTSSTPEAVETASVFDAPNAEKPTVKFFVMTFCPYGLQAEQGLEPVYQLLKDDVNWEPHYVVYENYAGGGPDYCIDDGNLCSMHGIDELMEGVRQMCIYNNYDQDTWWNYIKYVYTNCDLNGIDACWLEAADYAAVDSDMITTCAEDNAVEYMAAEKAVNEEYEVRGSPAIFVNDESYNGGRAPENFKNAICSGFENEPALCADTIGAEAVAASGSC